MAECCRQARSVFPVGGKTVIIPPAARRRDAETRGAAIAFAHRLVRDHAHDLSGRFRLGYVERASRGTNVPDIAEHHVGRHALMHHFAIDGKAGLQGVGRGACLHRRQCHLPLLHLGSDGNRLLDVTEFKIHLAVALFRLGLPFPVVACGTPDRHRLTRLQHCVVFELLAQQRHLAVLVHFADR